MTFIILVCFLLAAYLENTSSELLLNYQFPSSINIPNVHLLATLTNEKQTQAIEFARHSVEQQHNLDNRIATSRIKVNHNSISHGQLIDGLPSLEAMVEDRIADTIRKATRYLKDTQCPRNSGKECAKSFQGLSLPPGELKDKCMEVRRESPFQPYRRLLPADYRDGIYKIRKLGEIKIANKPTNLPQPRQITEKFFKSNNDRLVILDDTMSSVKRTIEGVQDVDLNILLPAWTQFIEQDLAKTNLKSLNNGAGIECCDSAFYRAPQRYTHPACSPLEISQTDQFYHSKHVSCLNYVRSSLAAKCSFGAAEQLNEASSLLDLSQVYGTSKEIQKSLRTFQNGLLKSTGSEDEEKLSAQSETQKYCFRSGQAETVCFKSGDPRVNSNPYVTILHTLFLRNHNRLAKELQIEHSNWSDNLIFEKARELNVATYQKITYEEWSKLVLGTKSSHHILTSPTINNNVVQGVSNEFATAAIRFYNSMLPGDLSYQKHPKHEQNVITSNFALKMRDILKLQNTFYRPKNFTIVEFNQILEAILNENAMAMDSANVDDLTLQYYRSHPNGFESFGSDVLALDIMRGRDHGLSPYIKYVEVCLNKRIQGWNDLVGIIKSEDLEGLRNIYHNPSDIDLIMGLFSEIPYENGKVGPTSVCILGEQLINTRHSDPNFYNKPTIAVRLSNISVAKFLCKTTDLQFVPLNGFSIPNDRTNPLVDCSTL